MMNSVRIVSIQVGMPRSYGVPDAEDPMDRPWTSGFVKQPVAGPVLVGRLNLEGDGQADLENHGGLDKAVLGYAADHYPLWRTELGWDELPWGAFGENLTLGGLTEADVCLGDVWQTGDVLLQVSQPRQPCWKLARRWRRKDLPKRVIQTGRSGWYFRVLREGTIQAGVTMQLVQRMHTGWSVARASGVLYDKRADPEHVAALRTIPELAAGWKSSLPG